jgi:FkbM family methyltransferase
LKTILWKSINALLGPLGFELRAKHIDPQPITMQGALARVRQRGIEVGTVIDLGAAAGRWARKAMACFPDARFLLIEPLEERRSSLETLRGKNPRLDFVIAAAGDREGTATLNVSPDLDGSGIYGGPGGARNREVPLTTVDAEVRKRGLPGPYFLKFDTHGFELPILAGAVETLKQTSVLVIEVYNFQISPTALRFHEMCAHLETLGLRCADIADPMLRPGDALLWQLDLIFLPATSPHFGRQKFG